MLKMSNQPWQHLAKFLTWKNQDIGYSSNCRYASILHRMIKVRIEYVENKRNKQTKITRLNQCMPVLLKHATFLIPWCKILKYL